MFSGSCIVRGVCLNLGVLCVKSARDFFDQLHIFLAAPSVYPNSDKSVGKECECERVRLLSVRWRRETPVRIMCFKFSLSCWRLDMKTLL